VVIGISTMKITVSNSSSRVARMHKSIDICTRRVIVIILCRRSCGRKERRTGRVKTSTSVCLIESRH